MKEEAPSKKLPPKMTGGSQTSTPTKLPNDEILTSLLRINNFDSISSIKDESLDIDLSACVTINPAVMLNGNSLSSTDFWRALDESAQTSQLELTMGSDESSILRELQREAALSTATSIVNNQTSPSHNIGGKQQQQQQQGQVNCFSGTFLRPEPPVPGYSSFSPLKKYSKCFTSESQQQQRQRVLATSPIHVRKLKLSMAIKEEPPEQLLADPTEDAAQDLSSNPSKSISASSFNVFTLPPESSKRVQTAPKSTKEAALEEDAANNPPVPLFKCLDCNGLVLHGKQETNSHEAANHRVLHMCNVCERVFEQEAGLKKHQKTHQALDVRKDAWKKCPECGKCLKLGSMWMHRKIHSDSKKYGCDICGQKFVQKINLTHHSRVHTAEKPFECPECQKRFQERSHLQRHQKYHAQTRSYRCDKCGKMYKTERCLKVHNLVHLEQRPFACNVCEKSFISNSKLKQHSNIHTGERPFKCNYCPRDFTNFPNWLKHTRRRHKVDHKTGEHLENIPSYCSKKSTKTVKTPKAIEAKSNDASAKANNKITASPNNATKETPPPAKPPVKRKRKVVPKAANPSVAANSVTGTAVPDASFVAPLNLPQNTSTKTTAPPSKTPKVKRERKQLAPKQVQKMPTQSLLPPPPLAIVKREPSLTTRPKGNFSDVNGLSITSAEELIMEQALEMEECGLYEAPISATGTDNAISAEAAAAMHFKIKNEFIDDEEEFISLRDVNQRIICSSLESSPYSSPASNNELTSSLTPALISTDMRRTPTTTTTYYIPNFPMTTTTTSSQRGSIITHMPNGITALHARMNSSPPPLVPQAGIKSEQLEQHQLQQQQLHTQTQALINHLYLPMTMSMPLLVQPNQALPSVDTLLFSTHANGGYFSGKSSSSSARNNLT